jgi:signal transduction histidine kinase
LKKGLFNLRFRTRLALVMFLITASTSGVLMVAYVQHIQKIKTYVAGQTSDLLQIVQLAQANLPPHSDRTQALNQTLKALKDAGLTSINVISPSGEVVASTTPGQVGKKVKLRRRRTLLNPGPINISAELHDVDIEPAVGEQHYDIKFPLIQGDKVIGYVNIGGEMDQVGEFLRRIYIVRLTWFLITMLAGMFLIVYLAFRFTKPIDLLVDASQQVAQGNLYVTLPASGTDEMGLLAQTFNQMVERLRENRKLQERLNEAEKSALVARLAATITHEVRNSLNFMNLSIDQIRAKRVTGNDPASRELQRNLNNMKDEVSRLNRLVNDFLAVGRQSPPAFAPCELHVAVEQAVALVEKQAHQQGIKIQAELAPELPTLHADAEQLRTCFLNILTNSLQAMPHGGRIHIAGKQVAENGGGRVELRFADTGPGIPRNDHERIFAPYFSTKTTGFGLGLAITKKIVEDHGGRIYVEDHEESGAVLTIELPVPVSPAIEAPAVTTSSAA